MSVIKLSRMQLINMRKERLNAKLNNIAISNTFGKKNHTEYFADMFKWVFVLQPNTIGTN